MPSSSNQFEQEIVNKVLIDPLDGLIMQEPFEGHSLRRKFNELKDVSVSIV
jgi:hypothetical protein